MRNRDWPNGPWDAEPDLVAWTDEGTGLPCIANRNPHLGMWCAYVGVDKDHPWYGQGYDSADVEVHGGLTFADGRTPGADKPVGLWWFGFDCGHFNDLCPGMLRYGWHESNTTYRDLAYVRAECASLAVQLTEAHPDHEEAKSDA